MKTSENVPETLTMLAHPEIEAAGDAESLPRFRMVAYSGGLMHIAGFPHPVVVDLAGMEIPSQSLPIRLDHERRQGVGHTRRIAIDDGKLVATGEPGEICIRGPQVMLGYWNRPDETAAVMLEDGWFRSGDIGRMDESGRTTIEDRKKDMILVSGFNVYPNEIEDVVQGHPGVLECAAVAKPDEHSGEVVKVFVVRKDAALSAEDIIEHCRGELTGYKIPRDVEFRDELPKTNVGKILRRQLRDEEKKRASGQ